MWFLLLVSSSSTSSLKRPRSATAGSLAAVLLWWSSLLFQIDRGAVHGAVIDVQLFKDIIPGAGASFPTRPTVIGGQLYFAASGGTSGIELFVSDGTVAGTIMVKDIWPGLFSSFPSSFVEFGGQLYFTAVDDNGEKLWTSNGTLAGTNLVKDIFPGSISNFMPNSFVVLDRRLYFVANDGTTGNELWVTDGSADGTTIVKDIGPEGTGVSGITTFGAPVVLNGKLFFVADDGTHGNELWSSNGSAAGTAMVKNICPFPGGCGSGPFHLTVLGDTLYFFSVDVTGTRGTELWSSDGTAAGTVMVKDFAGNIFFPHSLTVFDGKLYFEVTGNTNGALWTSDGTATGTTLVKDIDPIPNPGIGGSETIFHLVDGQLFFSADDGIHGWELWATNGTTAGTNMVKDIRPGLSGSTPSGLTIFDGQIYFAADDGTHGTELWTTDGTVAGTVLVKDIYPGPPFHWSNPQDLVAFGDKLYFTANDGIHGYELWLGVVAEAAPSALPSAKPSLSHPSIIPTVQPPTTLPTTAEPSSYRHHHHDHHHHDHHHHHHHHGP